MGRSVLGTTMATEFQKPTRTPSHDTPVQTSLHAARQASSVDMLRQRKELADADLVHGLERSHHHHVQRRQKEECRRQQKA
jgi:predicted protein tyrosine phosphatase